MPAPLLAPIIITCNQPNRRKPEEQQKQTKNTQLVTITRLPKAANSVEELILWLVIVKLEIGKIKERRYMKRGDGFRRHGRPPDLTFLAPSAPPPSRTPPPATTTFCPLEADEGVACPVDVLKGLPRNHFVALSGLSAAGNASPPTAKSGIPKSSELPAPNPANPSP